MTEDELKRLKDLPVPAPGEGARAAAVAAALAAFEAAAVSRPDAPQGTGPAPRLRDTTSVSEGSSRMRFRRPMAIAASIAALALVVPTTAYLMLAPPAHRVKLADRPAQKPGEGKVAVLPASEPPPPPVVPAPPKPSTPGLAPDAQPKDARGVAPPPGGPGMAAPTPSKQVDRLAGKAGKSDPKTDPIYIQTDRLIYDDKTNRVIAEGNVEIRYGNYILTADKVIYDRQLNKLIAEGSAQLKAPNGDITRADRLEATDDFRDAFAQGLSTVTAGDARVAAAKTGQEETKVASSDAPRAVGKVEARRAPTKAPPPAESSSTPPTAVTPPMDARGVRGFSKGGFSPKASEPQALTRFGGSAKFGSERGDAKTLGASADTLHPGQESRDRFAGAAGNPVKSVASEPVSTFSIDVDSASYAFVRRALNAGKLPPRAAVRVEEMINYFPYDYPLPEDKSAPFRPTVTVVPAPWNPANKLVHIAIKGYDVARAERPRANLVLLIDTSGSMAPEDRLPLLRNAFRMLIDTLHPDDTVGIVTYAGQSRVALEPTRVADKRRILQALDALQAGGSTAGGAGIQEAYRMAEGAFDKHAVNRIILATDGDFNVGVTGVEALKSLIERKRETGIYLSVLGVGRGNYNDALMQALAQNGNGAAAYIDTLNEARKVLVDEASSTLFPIAKDVKVQIEFNPAAVAEYRLIGYETRLLRREDFNNDRIDAGDIGSGHTVTAIYEITPVGSPRFVEDLRYKQAEATAPADAKGEYAFLKINYKLPSEAVSRRIELAINPALEAPAIDQAPADVRFSIAVAAFGQLLRGEPYLKAFAYDDVIALAGTARGEDPFGYRAELLNLVRLAKSARP